MKFVWLNQTDAAAALGISVNAFIGIKTKYKDNELTGRKKKYLIPYEELIDQKQNQYIECIVEDEEYISEQTKQAMIVDEADNQLKYARLQKILKQTEYISQKIVAKKEELFVQWTERFFVIFEKSFTKFKNSLIDLHLNDDELQKLNENLEYAIKNIQISLDEISKEYLEQEFTQE